MTAIEGRVLTPEGFRAGRAIVENGRIRSVEEARGVNNRVIGFVDLHRHGGGARRRYGRRRRCETRR